MRHALLGLFVLAGLAGCGGSSNSLDPNKQWMLAISSASVKATNNGANWDVDGSPPDVFVRFTVAGVSSDSSFVQDSYTPSWNPAQGVVVTTAVLEGSGVAPVTLQFWDSDITINDPVTDAFTLTLTEDQINSGTVTITNFGGLDSATFKIIPQP